MEEKESCYTPVWPQPNRQPSLLNVTICDAVKWVNVWLWFCEPDNLLYFKCLAQVIPKRKVTKHENCCRQKKKRRKRMFQLKFYGPDVASSRNDALICLTGPRAEENYRGLSSFTPSEGFHTRPARISEQVSSTFPRSSSLPSPSNFLVATPISNRCSCSPAFASCSPPRQYNIISRWPLL